jgi:hypothetical protein
MLRPNITVRCLILTVLPQISRLGDAQQIRLQLMVVVYSCASPHEAALAQRCKLLHTTSTLAGCVWLTSLKLTKKDPIEKLMVSHTMDVQKVRSWLGATTEHRCSTCRTKALQERSFVGKGAERGRHQQHDAFKATSCCCILLCMQHNMVQAAHSSNILRPPLAFRAAGMARSWHCQPGNSR